MADGSTPRVKATDDPSTKLALVASLLDMMINRFERHPEEMQSLFGGAPFTDLHTLMVIEEYVTDVKAILDEVQEVSRDR